MTVPLCISITVLSSVGVPVLISLSITVCLSVCLSVSWSVCLRIIIPSLSLYCCLYVFISVRLSPCLSVSSILQFVCSLISLCDCLRLVFYKSSFQLARGSAVEGSSSVSSPISGSQTASGHPASVLLIHWVREMA